MARKRQLASGERVKLGASPRQDHKLATLLVDPLCHEYLNKELTKLLPPIAGWVQLYDHQHKRLCRYFPSWDSLATPRHQRDVDKLREKAIAEKRELFDVLVDEILRPAAKDMHAGIEQRVSPEHLFVTTIPQVHLTREAYQVDGFVWLHAVTVPRPNSEAMLLLRQFGAFREDT